jgi:pyroglutamyl-peptidase
LTRLLISSFDPFGSVVANTSKTVVGALEATWSMVATTLVTAVLETKYTAAAATISQLIRHARPQVVICCGVSMDAQCIRLERLASNRDCSKGSDNAGEVREGTIELMGPDVYTGTLPYGDIIAAFEARDIPYEFSDDGGGFVCNHVFYRVCHEIAELGFDARCGFVHVPYVEDATSASGAARVAELVEALRACALVSAACIVGPELS